MGFVSRRLAGRARNLDIKTSADLAAFLRGSRETWSGANVSPSEAQKDAAWVAGLRDIAEDIGKLPFIAYYPGDDRRRAADSPWWTVIHDRVSRGWTSQAFREHLTYWAQHDGDAFALQVPSATQRVELIPFKRGLVRAEALSDGHFVYHVEGMDEPLPARRVFHLRGFASAYDGGADQFRMAREDIGLSLAMERHAGTFFKNGAVLGGVVEHPAEMSDAAFDRLKASLNEDYSGENSHNWLILEEGAKVSTAGSPVDPEKSQLLEARKFQVTETARRLRLPPHKIGDLEHATFTNIEHQAIEYVQDSLLPWALRWENAFNLQVITDGSVYAELLFDVLLRGDSAVRSNVYASAVQNGWMTQNDVRRRENLPPLDGGDVLLTPLTHATPAERDAKLLNDRSQAAWRLAMTGWDPDDVLAVVGLPPMKFIGKPGKQAVAAQPAPVPAAAQAAQPLELTVNVDMPALQITNEAQPQARITRHIRFEDGRTATVVEEE